MTGFIEHVRSLARLSEAAKSARDMRSLAHKRKMWVTVSLPGPPVVVKSQKEVRQHRVVDLVRVERHPPTLPVSFELRWRSWPHAHTTGGTGREKNQSGRYQAGGQ